MTFNDLIYYTTYHNQSIHINRNPKFTIKHNHHRGTFTPVSSSRMRFNLQPYAGWKPPRVRLSFRCRRAGTTFPSQPKKKTRVEDASTFNGLRKNAKNHFIARVRGTWGTRLRRVAIRKLICIVFTFLAIHFSVWYAEKWRFLFFISISIGDPSKWDKQVMWS